MREEKIWLIVFGILVQDICGALFLEGATDETPSVPHAISNGAAGSPPPQQNIIQEKPEVTGASAAALLASSIAKPMPSVQTHLQPRTTSLQQPSPSSPLPPLSQQQHNPSDPQLQTFFHRLHPQPVKSVVSPTQNPHSTAPVTVVHDESKLMRPTAIFTSSIAISNKRQGQTRIQQSQQMEQQTVPMLQAPNHVSTTKHIPATIPAQPTASQHQAPPKKMIPLQSNALESPHRRKSFRRPHHHSMISARKHFRSKGNTYLWPNGDYCIMPGNSGICPTGFAAGSVAFAVPINIKSHEMYRDGKSFRRYVELGKIGGFDVGSKSFDNIYKISLTACCRIKDA